MKQVIKDNVGSGNERSDFFLIETLEMVALNTSRIYLMILRILTKYVIKLANKICAN